MADKLLVRAYNVEVGDCVYCRIPDARKVPSGTDDFHMLIDCGSLGSSEALHAAIEHLKTELPSVGRNKKRLDLLVVTHEHKDHIAGFDPTLFENITIENIWMSAAMDRSHPQSERTFALQDYATKAMRDIEAEGLSLSPGLQNLMTLFGVSNDVAMDALHNALPAANDIVPKYVHAGDSAEKLGLRLNGVEIHVIAPENNIDKYYLGDDTADDPLRGFVSMAAQFKSAEAVLDPQSIPANISEADFRRLRSRMLSNAFAFADEAGKVINNTSVVLLIEWKGKRLLFVGDAEWDTRFKEGKKNASWNVMWHLHRDKLDRPIDFLKIGHHGSYNATPWNDREDGRETEASKILDAILPMPAEGETPTATAIVSTLRKNYEPIPSSALLVELGKRLDNTRNYKQALTDGGVRTSELPFFSDREKRWLASNQPLRTDFEALLAGENYVEVEIEP